MHIFSYIFYIFLNDSFKQQGLIFQKLKEKKNQKYFLHGA